MASFERALNKVLGHEGGYSDHAADRGGKTRFGVTEAVARRHGYIGYMADFPREQAVLIYRSDYWDAIHGDELPEALGPRLLDFAVNAGPGPAIRALQRALRVKDDGILGPQTLAALREFAGDAELSELIAERVRVEQIRHYVRVVQGSPTQAVFLMGWLNRALA